MIVKQPGNVHHTRDFGGDSRSDRVILPTTDDCRVKTTLFCPKAGFKAEGIIYRCDETAYVIRGALTITVDGQVIPVSRGATFHVPAGEVYSLEADVDSVLFCLFSAGPDGTLPDDE